MFSESSSSAFITSGNISNKWSEITCLQVRSRNVLYSGIRYGRKFLIKAIRPEYGSLYDDKLGHDIPYGHQHVDKLSDRVSTQSKILQEKEFRLGILLNHPHIMSTYSLEEVEDLGICIVSEWIEGITLCEWFKNKQNINARRRVFMQILDALEYIHSLQLVHNDIKLDNIMITTNGTNVKLIDFGLSNTDDTVLTESNDVRKDIVGVGKIMKRMFASSGLFGTSRYPITSRRALQGGYANIATLRKAFNDQNSRPKVVVFSLVACLLVALTAESHFKEVYNHHKYVQHKEEATQVLDSAFKVTCANLEKYPYRSLAYHTRKDYINYYTILSNKLPKDKYTPYEEVYRAHLNHLDSIYHSLSNLEPKNNYHKIFLEWAEHRLQP